MSVKDFNNFKFPKILNLLNRINVERIKVYKYVSSVLTT